MVDENDVRYITRDSYGMMLRRPDLSQVLLRRIWLPES